jgi:hypothetical protein
MQFVVVRMYNRFLQCFSKLTLVNRTPLYLWSVALKRLMFTNNYHNYYRTTTIIMLVILLCYERVSGSMLWSQFSAIFVGKIAFFTKINFMIKISHNLALFCVKNANNYFAEFFGENILKIITSVRLQSTNVDTFYSAFSQFTRVYMHQVINTVAYYFNPKNTRCKMKQLFNNLKDNFHFITLVAKVISFISTQPVLIFLL